MNSECFAEAALILERLSNEVAQTPCSEFEKYIHGQPGAQTDGGRYWKHKAQRILMDAIDHCWCSSFDHGDEGVEMNSECRCEEQECELHVRCDDNCRALLEPITLEDCKRSLEHWIKHRVNSGCSHGC